MLVEFLNRETPSLPETSDSRVVCPIDGAVSATQCGTPELRPGSMGWYKFSANYP